MRGNDHEGGDSCLVVGAHLDAGPLRGAVDSRLRLLLGGGDLLLLVVPRHGGKLLPVPTGTRACYFLICPPRNYGWQFSTSAPRHRRHARR